MKKMKNKKIMSIMLVLGMLSGVCMVSTAAGTSTATKNALRSQGAVRYQDGVESVVIDSTDLYTLADKLDLFKERTAQQLGAIGTYLSTDPEGVPLTSEAGIYAVHKKPSSSTEADPLSLSFETILEGIAASQSIPTDPVVYGIGAGTTLYKGADGKLSSEAQEGSEPISIREATAENLSAGTAAWVNGRLILGTGGDNQSYHDLGYQEASVGQESGSGPSGSDTPLNRIECIQMNTPGNVYVVPEDMNDVTLVFFGTSKFQLSFASSDVVTYKEIFDEVNPGRRHNVSCTMYFVPELKRGTGINIRSDECYLLRIKDPGKKSGNITSETISGSSYYAQNDMKDVLLLQRGTLDISTTTPTSTALEAPAFQEATGNPIVAFKQAAGYSNAFEGNLEIERFRSYSLYYIPELPAETVITKHSGGVLFY